MPGSLRLIDGVEVVGRVEVQLEVADGAEQDKAGVVLHGVLKFTQLEPELAAELNLDRN